MNTPYPTQEPPVPPQADAASQPQLADAAQPQDAQLQAAQSQPELAPTEASEPQATLSDAEIVRLVNREMGTPIEYEGESRSTLLAFGVTLVAFVYVCILIMGRIQTDEAEQYAYNTQSPKTYQTAPADAPR